MNFKMRVMLSLEQFQANLIDEIVLGIELNSYYRLLSRSDFYPNRGNPKEGRVYLEFEPVSREGRRD